MRFEIKELQRHYGFTILYVTHDQSEAMVMKLGVVQQIDTPANVYAHPANCFVFGFIGLSNFLDVTVADGKAHMNGSQESLPCLREHRSPPD